MQRQSRTLLQAILRSVHSATKTAACQQHLEGISERTVYIQTLANQSAQRCTPAAWLTSLQFHRGFTAQAQTQTATRAAYRGQQSQQRKTDPSGTQGLYLVAFTVAMIGVTYASVPLYRMFCQATGYGGTVQQGSTGICSHRSLALMLIDLSCAQTSRPNACMHMQCQCATPRSAAACK